MNLKECASVLAKIQLGDNRQVDELTVREWFDTIGHLDVGDAINAVREHRQTSTEYLMPAHVVAGALRSRERRERSERVEKAIEGQSGWKLDGPNRVRVWRAMLDSPYESERTKAWVRRQLDVEGEL